MTVNLNLQTEFLSKASISKAANFLEIDSFHEKITLLNSPAKQESKENKVNTTPKKEEFSEEVTLEENELVLEELDEEITLEPRLVIKKPQEEEPLLPKFQPQKTMVTDPNFLEFAATIDTQNTVINFDKVELDTSDLPQEIKPDILPDTIKKQTQIKSPIQYVSELEFFHLEEDIDISSKVTTRFSDSPISKAPEIVIDDIVLDNGGLEVVVTPSHEVNLNSSEFLERKIVRGEENRQISQKKLDLSIDDVEYGKTNILNIEGDFEHEESFEEDQDDHITELAVAIPSVVNLLTEKPELRVEDISINSNNIPRNSQIEMNNGKDDYEEFIETEGAELFPSSNEKVIERNEKKPTKKEKIEFSSKGKVVENRSENKFQSSSDINSKIENKLIRTNPELLEAEQEDYNIASLEIRDLRSSQTEIKFVKLQSTSEIPLNKVATPSEQINLKLHHAISNGNDRMEVTLSPEHLGRVDIHLEIKDGSIKEVKIIAQKIETLEAIIKDSKILEQTVREISKDSSLELNFSLRQDNNSSNMGQKNNETSSSVSDSYMAVKSIEDTVSEHRNIISDSKVDVRL